jgi:cytochrome P450
MQNNVDDQCVPVAEQRAETREYPYPEAVECPYAFYDRIRVESPVHKIPDQDMHFISLREDVIFAFDHPEVFSNVARNVGMSLDAKVMESGIEVRTMLDSDPPTQAKHKSFVMKYFNQGLFNRNQQAMREIVDELIDGFIDDGRCDFVSQFADQLPGLAIAHLLELPKDVRSRITAWGRLETSGVRFFSAERKEQQEKVLASLAAFSEQMVLERHGNLGNDVLSNIIRAQIERDGQFEPDYTKLTLAVLLTAGLLTTALMLSHGMRLLIDHPDQMQRVIDDHSLIPNMVDEIIRIESPAQWIPKRVAQDYDMRGETLQANSHACIGLAAANREEATFPNADKFDIFRKNASSHLAFGRGIHFCLGASLARLEGKIAFEQLLSRLKNVRFAADNDFKHIDSPSFRGLQKLNLEFDKA